MPLLGSLLSSRFHDEGASAEQQLTRGTRPETLEKLDKRSTAGEAPLKPKPFAGFHFPSDITSCIPLETIHFRRTSYLRRAVAIWLCSGESFECRGLTCRVSALREKASNPVKLRQQHCLPHQPCFRRMGCFRHQAKGKVTNRERNSLLSFVATGVLLGGKIGGGNGGPESST